ncbi:MAG TPA: helix-turn-helix transcriptional regulator, partial [Caldimonas sp.]|nr:helix-turn-helix transcriptional regulator [Caldimonas sp.]
RGALALFTVSLIAYLFCQRAELMVVLPYPLAVGVMALCVSSTAWLWLATRGLFRDDFELGMSVLAIPLAMVALGVAANLPRLQALFDGRADPGPGGLTLVHAIAMLLFTAAAVWEMSRGWRDDLVEPRRATRRWVALGIGAYASVALIVELAVRDRNVGALLPALHVAGIGLIALALAVAIVRYSIAAVLGLVPEPETRNAPPPSEPQPPPTASPALDALRRAMAEQHLYRREGLTLAALAEALGMGESALRALINQKLGYRNFNDFLHDYRLQEAAARLAAEDLPILTIALESGYGSIGPFNRAFRQRFAMTPTEYRAAARMERHRQTSGAA